MGFVGIDTQTLKGRPGITRAEIASAAEQIVAAVAERNFRPVEDSQQCVLVAKQPSEQPVKYYVTGSAAIEDSVEAGTQDLGF